MMLRVVSRVVLPLTFAATLCLPGWGQTANPAPAASPEQTAGPSVAASPDETADVSAAKDASTLGASTTLDSESNDVTSLYGTPVVQVIARVNDRVITNSDLQRAQSQLAEESRRQNWSLDQLQDGQKNLLRDLIDQQLLLSKGKQLGITGDTELIKRLDQIRKQNHLGTMDDLEKAVEQQGTSYEDFKANIRNSLITQAVVRQEVGNKMQISQAEIEKYYKAHLDSFTHPESIHLSEILIPTEENATSSQLAAAEAKANEVEAKLNAGGNFADLAKQYSGGPTAAQGGDLGDFKRGALAKVLEDQTFDLPVGKYTKPIRTRQGYIVLEVTSHTPGGASPMEKVTPEIEQALYMEQIQPAVRSYLTRLRNEAYIDIRPGYTDSGASPDESKPTYEAYVPPQPKKKKKRKLRFDNHAAEYGRMSDRKKATPAAATGTAVASVQKMPAEHKAKRVKFRFGHAPDASLSAREMEESESSSSAVASPVAAATAAKAAVASGEVQPLGPDLEHAPTIAPPPDRKRRYSDRARNKTHKQHERRKKVEKAKAEREAVTPSPLTPSELANRDVQSAPLGLAGDTVHKKKKKKVKVKSGEKTRFSDQKKMEKQDQDKQPSPDSTAPSSGDSSSSSAAEANPS